MGVFARQRIRQRKTVHIEAATQIAAPCRRPEISSCGQRLFWRARQLLCHLAQGGNKHNLVRTAVALSDGAKAIGLPVDNEEDAA